jgi:hypothetical protein
MQRITGWLNRFLRADAPESMTRALMLIGGYGVGLIATSDAAILLAVAYRVQQGLAVMDVTAALLGSATVIGALAAFAWGQARERSKGTPPAPDAPAPRPTVVIGQQEPG